MNCTMMLSTLTISSWKQCDTPLCRRSLPRRTIHCRQVRNRAKDILCEMENHSDTSFIALFWDTGSFKVWREINRHNAYILTDYAYISYYFRAGMRSLWVLLVDDFRPLKPCIWHHEMSDLFGQNARILTMTWISGFWREITSIFP